MLKSKMNKTKKNTEFKQKNGGTKSSKNPKRKSYKDYSKSSKSYTYKMTNKDRGSPDRVRRLYSALDEPRAVLKYPRKKGVVKQLRFGKNSIRSFVAESPESIVYSPKVRKCDYTELESDFPCKYENTVFNTLEEYNEYKKIKKERSASTGYKSRSQHYVDILGKRR